MADTQRERLIELIYSANEKFTDESITDEESVKILADYLLEHSVIVLPCKVGDAVYVIGDNKVEERTVEYFVITESCVNACLSDFMEYDIDEIFLTREDAERALRNRE